MNIKEWIASIFPVMPVPINKDSDSTRKAIITLVSIGELAKTGLDQFVESGNIQLLRIQLGSVMLGAYGEVMMAEHNITKSDLLSDEELLQMVKDLVNKPAVEIT
jgi:arginine decarboxylase-like protein